MTLVEAASRLPLQDVFDVLDERIAASRASGFSRAAIQNALRDMHQSLVFLDWARIPLEHLRQTGEADCRRLFARQVALRGQFMDWRARGLVDNGVERATRDVLRLIRFAIDLVGEAALGHPRLQPQEAPLTAFAGGAPRLLMHPEFEATAIRFQPGDVLVQRGRRHNSAAIARIGEIDSQFSHVSIVAHDDDGRLVAVEALIEDGAVITPLCDALDHGLGRAALFRFRDGDVARRAGEAAHRIVSASRSERGRPILYDFSMELGGYHRLYCAKLVRMAYGRATCGRVVLPTFPTRLAMKNRDFLKRIGVTARQTFAPGDFELEPDFQLVAEWRDFRMTSELRLKDLLMVKLFEWMDGFDYRFRPDLGMQVLAALGRLSTHLSETLRETLEDYAPRVPPNMTHRAIAAVIMLHRTAEPIYLELQRLEDETIRAHGRQLHPRNVFKALEAYRVRHGGRIGYLARGRA